MMAVMVMAVVMVAVVMVMAVMVMVMAMMVMMAARVRHGRSAQREPASGRRDQQATTQ
jgi:hypothetical protein